MTVRWIKVSKYVTIKADSSPQHRQLEVYRKRVEDGFTTAQFIAVSVKGKFSVKGKWADGVLNLTIRDRMQNVPIWKVRPFREQTP